RDQQLVHAHYCFSSSWNLDHARKCAAYHEGNALRTVKRQFELPSVKVSSSGQASSIAIAVASPPPMHSEATPRLSPRAFSACSRVTMRRAPLAPIGWPKATAPPLTLSFSCG